MKKKKDRVTLPGTTIEMGERDPRKAKKDEPQVVDK